MANAYPKSTFIGFDFDKESIKKAKESAKKENINNVKFEVSSASEFPGSSYDFVTFFDCLHDMVDPEGALTHLRNVIKKDDVDNDSSGRGTCMIVEPFAQDYANMRPQFINIQWTCIGGTSRRKQNKRCSNEECFSHFKRVLETPLNIIYEANHSYIIDRCLMRELECHQLAV